MPIQSSRCRASSVPRAAAPATLQIAEMQRMGVEQCLIDPAELTKERLLQDRQAFFFFLNKTGNFASFY
jgi:hypothetical protein